MTYPQIPKLLYDFERNFRLTQRECEIIEQLCIGTQSFESLSGRMFISPKTLKNHMQNIYYKTGTRSILELYSLIVRRILTFEEDQMLV